MEHNISLSFKPFLSITVTVLASAAVFGAIAQTPINPASPAAPDSSMRVHGRGLKALDTNNDNMISRDEAKGKPHLTEKFDAIDTNRDGQLSRDELRAYRKAHKDAGARQPKS